PVPSRLASDDEITALAGVLRDLNAGCLQHLALPSRELALSIRRPVIGTGPVQSWSQPGKWRQDLDEIDATFADKGQYWGQTLPESLEVFFTMATDPPVYIPSFDGLPGWKDALYRPIKEKLEILRDPAVRQKMRDDMTNPEARSFSKDWNDIIVEE